MTGINKDVRIKDADQNLKVSMNLWNILQLLKLRLND